jgi:AsmA protein
MSQRPPAPGTPLRIPSLEQYRPREENEARARSDLMRRSNGRGGPHWGQRRRTPRSGGSWWRYALGIVGGIAVVAATGAGALFMLAPVDLIRDEIIREVKAHTGRDLSVSGGTSLSLFPSLAVTLDNVSLSAPPGMSVPPLAVMRRLEARASLVSVLAGQFNVEQLVLTDPVVELSIDATGRKSWDFASLGARRIKVAQASGGSGAGEGMPPELKEFLRNATTQGQAKTPSQPAPAGATRGKPARVAAGFDDIRIVNGTIRYKDARTGHAEAVTRVNASVTAPSLDRAMGAKGDFDVRGERISFQTEFSTPADLIDSRPARVVLVMASDPAGPTRLNASFKGTVRPDFTPGRNHDYRVEGPIRIDAASASRIGELLGISGAMMAAKGPLTLSAQFNSERNLVSLNEFDVKVGEATAHGLIHISQGAAGKTRPRIKADLRIAGLDVNRISGRGEAPASGEATPPLRGSAPPDSAGPRVKGYVKREGWSEAPYDMAALGEFDAEARIGFSNLKIGDVSVEGADMVLSLDDRVLRTTLDNIRLYGGRGRGLLNLDARGRALAMGANLTLFDVAGLPFMKDVADLDWLDGKAQIQLALAGQGESEKVLVDSLNGQAKVDFVNGAIVGINIPQMVRSLGQGQLSGFERTATARTDFSEAAASFEIKAGVAETKDVRLLSPLIRMSGNGIVDIGQRTIEATLRPRLVGSLTGQGGDVDLSGLELPVKVSGPWSRPEITADMGAVLKDPDKAIETIKEFGRQLKKKGGLDKLIERFLR